MTFSSSAQRRVLVVGSAQSQSSQEFGAAVRWLRRQATVRTVECVDLIHGNFDVERINGDPLLIVLLHAFPGQYGVNTEQRIRASIPNCRVAHLLGAWCDGELRSLKPFPADHIVRWHLWQAGLDSFLNDSEDNESTGRPTDTDSIRIFAGSTLGIVTADLETAEGWQEIIQSCGCRALVLSRIEPNSLERISLVLWDESTAPRATAIPLRSVVEEVAPIPVVAALSFVRPSDRWNARQSGAVEILAKPFLRRDLAQMIYRYIPGALSDFQAGTPAA